MSSLTYVAWYAMIRRCCHPNNRDYEKCGGIGIRVCSRWRRFRAFLEDMGEKPSREYQLGRIENSGNYEPGNCIWITRKKLSTYRKSRVVLTFQGRTMTLGEWARELDLNPSTVSARRSRGLSVEACLSPTKKARVLTRNRVTKTVAEWSKELGIPKTTISARKARGWSDTEALRTDRSKTRSRRTI